MLPREEKGDLINAILCYVTGDNLPELTGMVLMAYAFITSQIDRDNEAYETTCAKRRENGLKGGRPKIENSGEINYNNSETKRLLEKAKKPNGYFENQSKAKKADNENDNETDTVNDTETETVNDTETETDIKDKRPPLKVKKKTYGAFKKVSLLDSELDTLKEKYLNVYESYIERVDGYVAQTGKKYSSHYATILNWMRKDGIMPSDEKGGCPY